jgi:diaminopimelate decarboxylase
VFTVGAIVFYGSLRSRIPLEPFIAILAGFLGPFDISAVNIALPTIGAEFSIRVNPDVDPKTHPYISTGLKKNKFGIHIERAVKDYEWAARRKHIEVVGVDCHIGSQLTDISPFVDAAGRVRRLVDRLLAKGMPIRLVDIGGGLGTPVQRRAAPPPEQYADAIGKAFRGLGVTLVLEPGRVLVGTRGCW